MDIIKNIKSKHKLLLYVGLLAYLIGILFLNYFFKSHGENINFQQPLFKILQAFPPYIVYVIILVQSSVLEEIAFRGWIMKKKFWKYLSFSLILFFLYMSFDNFILLAFVVPILFVIFFIIKNETLKTILLITFTSLLFGIMHYNNYESWARIFAIIQLIGLSLILCYIGMRFGFIYTIIGHFVNNLIALLLITIVFNTNYSGKFENTTYSAEITKISNLKFYNQTHWLFPDSIYTNGYITQIATELPPFKTDIIYKYSIADFNRYILSVKNKTGSNINKEQLFIDYINNTNLILDTTYTAAYTIKILDSLKLCSYKLSKSYQKTNIQSLTTSIRSIYELPIVLERNYINYNFNIDWKILRIKSVQELINRLKNEYGILLTKDNEKRATIITIRE